MTTDQQKVSEIKFDENYDWISTAVLSGGSCDSFLRSVIFEIFLNFQYIGYLLNITYHIYN